MDEKQQKEQFSNAYLSAVAAAAGFAVSKPSVDDDSVDWTIAARGRLGTYRSPKLDLQLKCTSQNFKTDRCISFPLKIKNYNDLRFDDYVVPRILVIVTVPTRTNRWILQSSKRLIVYRSAYWVSIRGMGATSNSDTVNVPVPYSQLFTANQLGAIMARIGSGGLP